MAIFKDEKKTVLVDDGQFYVRGNGSIFFTTTLNKMFEFPVSRVSITLTANTQRPETGHSKHFTGYTSTMYDDFYEIAGCWIDKAHFEWYVHTLKDDGTIERTEEMKYIHNFKMKLDINYDGAPVWRIDFDYGNY